MLMLLKQFLQKNSSKTNCRNLRVRFRIGNSSSQRSFAESSSFNIFVVFTKYEKSRDENGQEKESRCFSHTGGAGPPLAAPPWCENTSELVSISVCSCDFPSMYNFRLYNPPEYPMSVYRFLVVFLFRAISVRDYFQLLSYNVFVRSIRGELSCGSRFAKTNQIYSCSQSDTNTNQQDSSYKRDCKLT
jgi:hypothetical protein